MQNTHNVLIVFCFHTLFSSLLLFCCSNNLLYTQQSGIKASCLKQFKNVKWIFIFVENGRMSVKNTTQLSVCIRHHFCRIFCTFLSEAQASCSNTFTVYKQLSSISIHGGNSKAILKYVSDTV